MKTRKELSREYRERQKPAGIYRIRNKANGRVLVGSSLDLGGPLNSHRFRLSAGLHPNEALQKDWNEFGPDAFEFEIVESIAVVERPGFDLEVELALIEEIWAEKLKELGALGYNTDANLRRP
jgi:hypothetical protein